MLSTRSRAVWWLCLTTSGKFISKLHRAEFVLTHSFRLLDKIAKDIMVCENKTVTRWDGSIGDYKKHLRKKMMAAGGV